MRKIILLKNDFEEWKLKKYFHKNNYFRHEFEILNNVNDGCGLTTPYARCTVFYTYDTKEDKRRYNNIHNFLKYHNINNANIFSNE